MVRAGILTFRFRVSIEWNARGLYVGAQQIPACAVRAQRRARDFTHEASVEQQGLSKVLIFHRQPADLLKQGDKKNERNCRNFTFGCLQTSSRPPQSTWCTAPVSRFAD